jgi:hypothetical protein
LRKLSSHFARKLVEVADFIMTYQAMLSFVSSYLPFGYNLRYLEENWLGTINAASSFH